MLRRSLFRTIKYVYTSRTAVRSISTSNSKWQPISHSVTLVFGKYLLLTNTVSSGLLLLLGDLAQQEIEFQQQKLQERYDMRRMARMFLVGLALGPVHHYYYVWIAKKWPARTAKIITWKIILDQFVMSPICIVAFFYGMGLLERKSLDESTKEMTNKFKAVYLMDWLVWPPTQFINFYYVPVKYQVLYINAVTMFYDIFLSYIKHREHAEQVHQLLMVEAKASDKPL